MSMPWPIRHYFHVFAGGAWAEPVREHIEALGESAFPGPVTIGLIGADSDRFRAREMIMMRMEAAGLPMPAAWLEAPEGYEQFTLQQMQLDIHQTPGDLAVLYAHTKGARDNSDWNATWRRSMTHYVVSGWRRCLYLLTDPDVDTVGCHWLTPEEHHDPPDYPVRSPFYGGNFWWAKASYLRSLPPVQDTHRFQAEEWVGLNSPRAYDLLPGWPSRKLFGLDKQ